VVTAGVGGLMVSIEARENPERVPLALSDEAMLRSALFVALALFSLTPWASAPLALVAGITFALLFGTPFAAKVKVAQTWLLQASVVGLGAATNLAVVLRVGATGVLQTAVTLVAVFAVGMLLARWLRIPRTTALLIASGTAICGGSAIAAVGPVLGAKSQEMSVSLAVVFLLNALALVVFPAVGHGLALDPHSFGLWSALAIHDTSSVVGASMQFGPEALATATTVKLARALWIIPVTLALSRFAPLEEGARGPAKRPWFIAGFVAMAAIVTVFPALAPIGRSIAAMSRSALVLTLFLIGAGVSRDALRAVGARPFVLGVALWTIVSAATLAAIRAGLLR
jgi:uncharacterized integral membrane protein (TIGR00698 family)